MRMGGCRTLLKPVSALTSKGLIHQLEEECMLLPLTQYRWRMIGVGVRILSLNHCVPGPGSAKVVPQMLSHHNSIPGRSNAVP